MKLLLKNIKNIILFLNLPSESSLFRRTFKVKKPLLEKIKVGYLVAVSFMIMSSLNYILKK